MASGSNQHGQFGIDPKILPATSTFVKLNFFDKTVKQIACGWSHSLLLTEEGQVYSSGDGGRGQLGVKLLKSSSEFVLVPIEKKVIQICCSLWASFALLEEGSVFVWGQNRLIFPEETFEPKTLVGLYDVVKLAVGHRHLLALHKNGTVSGFGCNKYGQILLTDVNSNVDIIKDIFAGWNTSIIQFVNGGLLLLGKNDHNQLGNGSLDKDCQKHFMVFDEGIKQIAVGSDHALVLTCKGLFTWGWNEHGTLGQGNSDPRIESSPIQIQCKHLNINNIYCGNASSFYTLK